MPKLKAKKPNNPKPNNPSMAYRYQRAYEKLFKNLAEPLQERILAVKAKPDTSDKYVNDFVKQVIELAESDKEL